MKDDDYLKYYKRLKLKFHDKFQDDYSIKNID